MTNYKVRGNGLKNNEKSTKRNNMNRTASCYQTNSSVVLKARFQITWKWGDCLQNYNLYSARQKRTKLEKNTPPVISVIDSNSPVSKSILANSIHLSIIVCLEKAEVISRLLSRLYTCLFACLFQLWLLNLNKVCEWPFSQLVFSFA